MTVENEAFIDIEMALHNRVKKAWNQQWGPLQKRLNILAAENTAASWNEAHKISNNIDWAIIVEDSMQFARTLAEAALFLGASRIDDPAKSSFFGEPDEFLIDIAVAQWATVLVKNATQALRLQVQVTLSEMEVAAQQKNLIVKAGNPLAAVGTQGSQFSGIAASLMISRASTAGFFAEAQARGIQVYKVSEVLDSLTCPVCRLMNNQEYPVAAGVAQSMSVMQSTDPDSLKSISPWPSQSAANVKRLGKMNQGALIHAGLNLPPYHPWCRGIATIVTKGGNAAAAAAAALAVAQGEAVGSEAGITEAGITEAGVASRALASSGDLTPDELANRLFGTFDELESAQLDGILGLGVGALFGVGDEEEDEEEGQ